LNGTHQPLAYADDINVVGEKIDTIKKITEALLDSSNEVGLEVNPDKTRYMLVTRSQKIGQKHSIKVANRSFEDVAKLKYLGTTLSDQNCMHEDKIRRMLATIRFRVFCPPACCLGTQRLEYTKQSFCQLFCIGVKLGL
jgi:hypothetical protein